MNSSLNILLVEDVFITAVDIQETLERAGHRVIAIAGNYQEALAAVEQQPDLAIIDIVLSGSSVDGITTARELLKIHWMPIIYLTAQSEPEVFQQAKDTLPAAFLLKPFRHNELAFQVELAYLNHTKKQQETNVAESENLYLPAKKGYEKIRKSQVVYLMAEGSYVKVFMADEDKPRLFTMNLGYLAQYFPTTEFYRLSRSHLINLEYVVRLERTQLYMHNQPNSLPIPEGNRNEIMRRLAVVRTR
ncbi:hypothetical protein GCM10027592_23210 [Spirosoma flavus]